MKFTHSETQPKNIVECDEDEINNIENKNILEQKVVNDPNMMVNKNLNIDNMSIEYDQKDLLKIKILLFNLKSTNREFQEIISSFDKINSVDELFSSILSINNFTNLEMYEYLSILSQTTIKDPVLINKFINLKFYPDKDTDLVILEYFSILNKLKVQDTDTLFTRYILLLNSTMFNKTTSQLIFDQFMIFLKKYSKYKFRANLLNNSVYKYKVNIDTTNIKLIFTQPSLLLILINNTSSKYLIQEYLKELPNWLIKSLSHNVILDLYNNFDCEELYRPVCYMWFKGLSVKEQLDFINNMYNIDEQNKDYNSEEILNNINGNYLFKTKIFNNDSINQNLLDEQNYFINFQKINIEITDEGSVRKIDKFDNCCIKNKFTFLYDDITSFNKTKDLNSLYYKYKKNIFYILRFHHLTNLKSLGEFLCNHKNLNFLKEFTDTFDFTNLNLLEAMRCYLDSFYLVGETQNIHRILEIFSRRYCENVLRDNVNNVFIENVDLKVDEKDESIKTYNNNGEKNNNLKTETDSENMEQDKNIYYDITFQITFSLLLLNTKMHNPNIKTKPSFEEYMMDFKDENMGPYDANYMLEMYTSIKNHKLNVPSTNKRSLTHFDVYNKIYENDKFISNDYKKEINTIKFSGYNKLSNNEEVKSVYCFNNYKPHKCLLNNEKKDKSVENYVNNRNEEIKFGNYLNIEKLQNCFDNKKTNNEEIFIQTKPDYSEFLFYINRIYTYLIDNLIIENPTFLDISYEKFLIVCKNVSLNYVKIYLIYNRENFYRFLNMFNFYLQQPGELRIFKIFINILAKISIKKSSEIYQIQNQYRQIYNKIITNEKLNVANIIIIKELIKINTKEYIIKPLVYILKSNINNVQDITYLSTSQKLILYQDDFCYLNLLKNCEDKFNVILSLLENNQIKITEEFLEFIKNINNYSEDSFYVLMLIRINRLKTYLNFEFSNNNIENNIKNLTINSKTINTNNSTDERNIKCVLNMNNNINENRINPNSTDVLNLKLTSMYNINKINEILDDEFIKTNYKLETWKKLNLFYTSSLNIYNDKILKNIIKKSCLRKCSLTNSIPFCVNFMLKKCKEIDIKENINYTLWIINLISSSLVVLINVLKETEDLSSAIKKIFISRLKKYSEGAHLCCECGYTDSTIVEEYLKTIVNEKKISKKEIEFFRFTEL